ncbi:hypothetical protein Taro_029452 [Colocasia esculenta]|uniref:BED-type domain-containing protein n=1 Tax=Colocasia esculenta TaxID=4460 RepID=A0A843VR71_COLES|nr:hypothetical protein [Colocasia esculenta]
MAPKKDNSEDIGWQHGTALDSRHNYKCIYCGHTGQGGGISRLKKHLAGGRLAEYHDVQGCKSVPTEVKRLMVEHLKGVRAETVRKRADREMQERIISGRQRDEDNDDEPKIYAEHVPDQPLSRSRQQTRVESWEAEQRWSFEVGSGSGGSRSRVGGEAQSHRFSNVGDYFTHIPAESTFAGTLDGKEVEGIIYSTNFWDRVFKLVQIIEPLYEVLRVVNGDRRPTIGLVYAKNEAGKKKISYHLHPAYHYAMELSYDDDLTATFTRVVERLSKIALDAADAIDQESINLPT